jgi:hypothetical protein
MDAVERVGRLVVERLRNQPREIADDILKALGYSTRGMGR